jgi:hypothetical protein|nr:MAG TPA: hypothetical protein [Caudoviricetes sp.]
MHVIDTRTIYSLVIALVIFTLLRLLIFISTGRKGPEVLEIAQVITFILIIITYIYIS